MKWVVFALMIVAVPIMATWLRSNPQRAPLLSGLLGVLIFVYAPYYLLATPLPWPFWSGYVKGVQVTVLDVIALAIVINNFRRRYKIPFQWQMLIYLLAVIVAIPLANVPIAASFYAWQLLRVYVVFIAIALVAQDDRHSRAIFAGLILGLAFQAGEAVLARAHGVAQSGGTLGHQNLLGMLCNMVLMPAIAMMLARVNVRWAAFGIFVGAIALVCTASRAAIGIGAFGAVLVILLSLARNSNSRKMGMTAMAVLALVATAPFAISSLSNRFHGVGISFSLSEEDVRVRMVNAAEMMITDYPFGVGANHFVVMANTKGYWHKAGVPVTRGNMAANVHNSYLLVQAETGFLGLGAILIILASTIIYPLYVAFKNKRNLRGDLLIGISVGLVTFALQNRVEWGVVSDNVQYMLAINFGLIAGIVRSIKVGDLRASHQRRLQEVTLNLEDATADTVQAVPDVVIERWDQRWR